MLKSRLISKIYGYSLLVFHVPQHSMQMWNTNTHKKHESVHNLNEFCDTEGKGTYCWARNAT